MGLSMRSELADGEQNRGTWTSNVVHECLTWLVICGWRSSVGQVVWCA
jgi:hypothetical protein